MPSHEIFQQPLKANLEWEDRPSPEHYRIWPLGEKIGKTIKVWKVQTKNNPDIDPGLVSDPYGFDDSPDTEAISSGLCGKGPHSLALARHGNFFLWGFSAQPTDMTSEARKCFVNSICYIKKFDGQRPLLRKNSSSRQWALIYAGYMKNAKDGKIGTLTVQQYTEWNFPEDVRKRFGTDVEKYLAYYQENLEYLRPTATNGVFFAVDEDVKSLGLSNRKIELLERCITLLEKGEKVELAQRILKRYTNERFTDAKEWKDWLEKNRERLFFSDVGGFRFYVAPKAKQTATSR